MSIEENRLPVLLSIRGEQYFDGMEPDITELMTEGTMELMPEGVAFSYEESALTGMEGTTTTFETRGRQVILTRSGAVNSQMIFEEGRQHTLWGAVGGYPDQPSAQHGHCPGRTDGDQIFHCRGAHCYRKELL